ncbi:MAG TPA: metalloregulator ArsR/SmtB family transcription factor [Vicinamibacterales bacterium]|nr:metalloregulator ArsR/SmtB family transcription factor [Vicinamibacterales bacterium]
MSRTRNAAVKFSEAAPVFAALGEPTRLTLVAKLCAEGPLSISRLSEGTGVTRQAITKHLLTLADAGLVHDTRSGRERIWQLETKRLEKARRCLDQISDQWDDALARLRAFVEDS